MPTDALRKETEECINNILKNNLIVFLIQIHGLKEIRTYVGQRLYLIEM